MKTIKSQLPKSAQQAFGGSKQISINGFTIKYFYSKSESKIVYNIFNGKGKGSAIAATKDYNEAVLFTCANVVYRRIVCTNTNKEGGAWFIEGTEDMFFDQHPFKDNFKIK